MKKVCCTFAAFAAFAVLGVASVSADIIAFEAVDLRDDEVVRGPDAADLTVSLVETFNLSTFSLTASNQDLDGIGGLNDSFSFDLVVTPSGGNAGSQISSSGTDVRTADAAGELITFSVGNIEVLASDDPTAAVNFNGFTGVTAGSGNANVQNNSFDIQSSDGTNLASFTFALPGGGDFVFLTDSVDFAANETTFSALNAVRSGGSLVVRNFDLEFHVVTTAVPEPSSLALLGLLGGLMTVRRRK